MKNLKWKKVRVAAVVATALFAFGSQTVASPAKAGPLDTKELMNRRISTAAVKAKLVHDSRDLALAELNVWMDIQNLKGRGYSSQKIERTIGFIKTHLDR